MTQNPVIWNLVYSKHHFIVLTDLKFYPLSIFFAMFHYSKQSLCLSTFVLQIELYIHCI